MLKQRIITALILASFIIADLIFLPFEYFSGILLSIAAIAAWEWGRLSGLSNAKAAVYGLALAGLSFLLARSVGIFSMPVLADLKWLLILTGAFWLLALYFVLSYPENQALWAKSSVKLSFGVFVIAPSMVALLYLLSLPHGAWHFAYLVLIVVFADVSAYFSGKRWGNKKLLAAVSPGKSWAGFYGGVVGCVLWAVLAHFFWPHHVFSFAALLIITPVVGAVSVLGDLFESMLKRQCGMKDSSQLLPGHGGVMDRIDSITAAAPLFVLFSLFIH